MKVTCLNKGEYFKYNGVVYKKLQDREKGNSVENVATGEICSLPLMLNVDKMSEEEVKPKKKREKVVESAVEPTEPPTEPTELPERPTHPSLKPRTQPDIIID